MSRPGTGPEGSPRGAPARWRLARGRALRFILNGLTAVCAIAALATGLLWDRSNHVADLMTSQEWISPRCRWTLRVWSWNGQVQVILIRVFPLDPSSRPFASDVDTWQQGGWRVSFNEMTDPITEYARAEVYPPAHWRGFAVDRFQSDTVWSSAFVGGGPAQVLRSRHTLVAVPCWSLILVFSLVPAARVLRRTARRVRTRSTGNRPAEEAPRAGRASVRGRAAWVTQTTRPVAVGYLRAASSVSLVLIAALWARSYWVEDMLQRSWERVIPSPTPGCLWEQRTGHKIASNRGGLEFEFMYDVHRRCVEWSEPERTFSWYRQPPEPVSAGPIPPPARVTVDRLGFLLCQEYMVLSLAGGPGHYPMHRFDRWGRIPFWAVVLPAAAVAALTWRSWAKARRARRRELAGLCRACGYDLRASPGRCPECGAVDQDRAGATAIG